MYKLCFIFITFYIQKLNGWSGGAPSSVCDDETMTPHHGSAFQTNQSPYSVVINSCNISYCSVKIEGTSDFRGIFLRAVNEKKQFIGSFMNVDSTTKLICNDGALTHNQPLSVKQLQANWIVGKNFTGLIQFRATIVKDRTIFWNVISSPYNITTLVNEATTPASVFTTLSDGFRGTSANFSLKTQQTFSETSFSNTKRDTSDVSISSSTRQPPSISSQTLTTFNVSHIKSCLPNKGCFLCSNQQCVVTWSQGKPNYVDFQISSNADNENRYIAIAFSKDEDMGDDSIIICSKSMNSFTAELWYSTGKTITKVSNPQESLDSESIGGLYSENWMSCVFSKQIKRMSSVVKRNSDLVYYLDDQMYYLLYATGPISQGNPQQHDYRTFSLEALNFTDFQSNATGAESSSNSLVKAHGILMVIAWLMMASVSILLPRYFKSAWPDKKILNKPIWFPIHQILMVLVFLLTAIAFIIIFCEVRGYVQDDDSPTTRAHAPIGIIIMILVVLNPVMALVRCNPEHKYRWVFNYFHTFVGEFVLILAVINIFLSFFMPQANIGDWVVWVMVALVCWHALIEFLLVMHERYLQSIPLNSNHRQNNIGMELDEPRTSPIINISVIKSILIASQWIGVTGLAIAVCVGIGVA